MSKKANKMFDSDSNSEGEDLNFSTNAKFAKSYDKSSSKELLKKWKTQEVDSEESSSSSDESEDDVGFDDEEFDKTFFSTLASIKARDPKIYQKDVKFFGEVDLSNRKRSKDDKPITIRDLERKVLVEHGGMFEETEGKGSHLPVMTEEEKEDKKLFQQFYSDSDGEENGAESLFKAKKVAPVDDKPDKTINPEIIKPISVFWNDPNISKEEAYLRDYILKRRFTDDGEGDELPNLTEDEEDLDKQAEFEQKINFRFEEQDHDFIKRFPRTIATSVRNVDDKRKQKRAEVKERKAREKEERKREIEKLKELKKKEIEEKISRLKQVAGSESIQFDDADLSDEFDPEAHDRKMQEIFNDEYYDVDEGEDKPECPDDIEDLKIVDWDNYDPAEDEEIDPVDPHCDDPDFNMDCEYDPKAAKKNFEQEMIENSQSRKRKKRRSKFAEVLRKQKPVFNPEDEKTYAEYVDEYYKLDCEDIIGDVKCRFKYVETVPNDFGLSVEEILMAKNKELNKWASLKKAMQIRPKSVEMNEVQQYDRRRKNWFLKKNILKSVYGEESEDEEEAITVEKLTGSMKETKKEAQEENIKDSPKKKKSKKKAQKVETITKMPEDPQGSDKQSPEKESKKQKKLKVKQNLPQTETNEEPPKKKNKRKAEETQNEQRTSQNPRKKFKTTEKKVKSQVIDYETAQGKFAINEKRLMAFGINPKKFRSKVKYGNSEKKANPQKRHKKKHQKQKQ